jgi:hypothetical protein
MTTLVKFQADWADEHDVYGFRTYNSPKEIEKVFTYVEAWFDAYPGQEIELGFGTNQQLTFGDFISFYDSFTITELTDDEFQTLQKLFPGWREGVVDFGWNGWADVVDYLIPCPEDENERLTKLADELWPPREDLND